MAVKKSRPKARRKKRSLLARAGIQILKSPYYAAKGTIALGKGVIAVSDGIAAGISKAQDKSKKRKVKMKRKSMKAKYDEIPVVHRYDGDIDEWENMLLHKDSSIGIIIGARGTGKSAIGIKLLENIYSKTLKKMYALGFQRTEMPSWIHVVDSIAEVKNNSVVLIDEGGILFSARRAMSNVNKMISDLILISRHKNITILFISQNSANLDINIIRQADHLIMKPSSLLQKDFERKKIKEVYEEVDKDFKKFKGDPGLTYIYSNDFRGFVSNPLPSFWTSKLSKSFSG